MAATHEPPSPAPWPATSPLVTMHRDTFPMQMAFALPKHPSPAFLPLPQCLIQLLLLLLLPTNVTRGWLVHHLATKCHLPLLTGMQRSQLPVAHSNPYPVAPGIFEDPSPLFLHVIPLLPCCSHWSFMADVKESKLRTLIVFVGGNLVTAFGFSSGQADVWGLEEPARTWGQEALSGVDQTEPDQEEGGGVFGLQSKPSKAKPNQSCKGNNP